VGSIVNGRVVVTQESPLRMVTRTMTIDDQSVAMFAQRMANLTGWTDGDVALPGLEATAAYWMAEAAEEAGIVAELQHQADLAAAKAAALGNGVTGIQ
jgi:hypothetical protein